MMLLSPQWLTDDILDNASLNLSPKMKSPGAGSMTQKVSLNLEISGPESVNLQNDFK